MDGATHQTQGVNSSKDGQIVQTEEIKGWQSYVKECGGLVSIVQASDVSTVTQADLQVLSPGCFPDALH